jgi:hypothetical protein
MVELKQEGRIKASRRKRAEKRKGPRDVLLNSNLTDGKRRPKGGLFEGMRERFSELQTVWRWAQSPANPSPAKIPDNREKYREFEPAGWPYRVYPLVKTTLTGFQPEIVTGP